MSLFVRPDRQLLNGLLNQQCGLFNVRGYPERQAFLSELFKRRVNPFYGDATSDLEAIKTRDDWKARILCVAEEPVAVVVFRTVLVNDDNTGKSLQIKYLFTTENKHNKQGHEKTLIDYVKEVLKTNFSNLPDISLSCCDREPDALIAYKKEGFEVWKEIKNFNVVGITQIFLKLKGEDIRVRRESASSSNRSAVRIDLPALEERVVDYPIPAKRKREDDHEKRTRESPVERIPLKGIYLNQIKSGRKTVEGRINSGMFARMSAGRAVEFFNANDSVKCLVTGTKTYRSFREMLSNEGFTNCLPFCRTLEDAASEYDRIPNYSEKARIHGVIAIRLELQNN